jgi:hypothetical protein
MDHNKKLGLLSCVFLGLFLFLFLPSAQSDEFTGNAPIMVASQEATIPLSANAVKGATESECPYTLTFKLAAVALHRENNKSQKVISASTGYPGPIDKYVELGAGDFNLGWAPGMDTSIMLQNECFGIELRYLGLAQWDESSSGLDGDDGDWAAVGGKFKSRLHNAELNLHWWPCANDRYSLLAGFRWFQLTDRFSGYADDQYDPYYDFGKNNYFSQNDLYGGQLGAEGLLFGKRDQGFSIDGGVKAGVFANKIHDQVKWVGWGYDPFGYWEGSASASEHRTKTAFLGEVILNATYAFTKNIAMTVGYQFLYVNKVAVPINNYQSTGGTQSGIFNGIRTGLLLTF